MLHVPVFSCPLVNSLKYLNASLAFLTLERGSLTIISAGIVNWLNYFSCDICACWNVNGILLLVTVIVCDCPECASKYVLTKGTHHWINS